MRSRRSRRCTPFPFIVLCDSGNGEAAALAAGLVARRCGESLGLVGSRRRGVPLAPRPPVELVDHDLDLAAALALAVILGGLVSLIVMAV